ncbi:glycosyltransferase [Microbulbifer sediminum]|uniref:glycosyltransferase n=1 Tax=Microbulbifer sediminum TaxID=2904250 RepID=UPI001F453713|nr:glycosyltransferase [Microbulbifer sediminum]
MKNTVVIMSTAYPVDSYIARDFFTSLLNQSNKKFDILVVNDGYEGFHELKEEYKALNIIELPGISNIAKNRELLINTARLHYELGIFCDFDDVADCNRVEAAVSESDNADIIVNDLDIYSGERVIYPGFFQGELKHGQKLSYQDIKEKNYFGLSNTSVNLKKLFPVNFPEELKIVDWYFYSILLHKGLTAQFTNSTKTLYRQDGEHLANLLENSREQFQNELEVKKKHYSLLSSALPNLKNEFENFLSRLNEIDLKQFDMLSREVMCSERESHAWWSMIQTGEII